MQNTQNQQQTSKMTPDEVQQEIALAHIAAHMGVCLPPKQKQ